jgi:hypothetical protein
MKTQEEIEQLAKEYSDIGKEAGLTYKEYTLENIAYKKGYTQCQEDMALSQSKEVEPQTEITSAELWQNRYESLLKSLNDLTTQNNIFLLNKEADLFELKEQWFTCDNLELSNWDIWHFFLPHLQKPVDSDAVEFAEWLADNASSTTFKGKWLGKELEDLTTQELYHLFKQD